MHSIIKYHTDKINENQIDEGRKYESKNEPNREGEYVSY